MNNVTPPTPAVPQPDVPGIPAVEIGLHGFLLLAGLLVFCFSIWMQTDGETVVYLPGSEIPLPDVCTSKQVFGVDCPGCGLTRGFISISHGQFLRAWHFNPASFVVYILVVGQVPWQIFQLSRIRRGQFPVTSNWVYLVPALAAVCLVVQWVIKMCFPA